MSEFVSVEPSRGLVVEADLDVQGTHNLIPDNTQTMQSFRYMCDTMLYSVMLCTRN